MNSSNIKSFYRLSLFKAFVIFTLICVALAFYTRIRARALAQQSAVQKLTAATGDWKLYIGNHSNPSQVGSVAYDFQLTQYNSYHPRQLVPISDRTVLGDLFGLDFVQSVVKATLFVTAEIEHIDSLNALPGLSSVEFIHGLKNQTVWNRLVAIGQLEEISIRLNYFEPKPSQAVMTLVGSTFEPIELVNLPKLVRLRKFAMESGSLGLGNLRLIGDSESIRSLRLNNIYISPDVLTDFPVLANVEDFFWNTGWFQKLDDEQFRFIESFPKAQKVYVSTERRLTDQIFFSLRKLKNLQEFSIHGTQVTGCELGQLIDLPLKVLELGASKLDDAGLAELTKLKGLTRLEIGSSRVTNGGMESVAKLTNLQELSIRDTAVGDAGLAHLYGLKNLKVIRIRDTNITKEALAKFSGTLPKCRIDYK